MTSAPLPRLLNIMKRLRDPRGGCEWDRAQTFETIAPYTIEEAYEVADAIERSDLDALKGELGDLLLQVVFHSQIASELGEFDFDDVANAIADKMVARHPHIFGSDSNSTMNEQRWEDIKAAERAADGERSAMDGIALALPAALRAYKLQKRAARDGFDWPDPSGPSAKLEEEMDELASAKTGCEREEEAGDLMFAAVNLCRAYGVNAETALRFANAKFERRYRAMESLSDKHLCDLSLDEQESLWQAVKRDEAHHSVSN